MSRTTLNQSSHTGHSCLVSLQEHLVPDNVVQDNIIQAQQRQTLSCFLASSVMHAHPVHSSVLSLHRSHVGLATTWGGPGAMWGGAKLRSEYNHGAPARVNPGTETILVTQRQRLNWTKLWHALRAAFLDPGLLPGFDEDKANLPQLDGAELRTAHAVPSVFINPTTIPHPLCMVPEMRFLWHCKYPIFISNMGTHWDCRIGLKIIMKGNHLSYRGCTKKSLNFFYLTQAEPLGSTAAINHSLRKFPMNSAAVETECPLPLA